MISFVELREGADTKEVMRKIHRRVQMSEEGFDATIVDELSQDILNENVLIKKELDRVGDVNPIPEINTNNPIKKFAKKVVRKIMMWYEFEVVSQQNIVNYNLYNMVKNQEELLGLLVKECRQLEDKNFQLQAQINNLKEERVDEK
ncbi:MAG: hypothetical protein K6F30_03485 [Lachnospiraceae bacterium]|nr:hypothetical protein [Lachnospiraceae bacterium]